MQVFLFLIACLSFCQKRVYFAFSRFALVVNNWINVPFNHLDTMSTTNAMQQLVS